jgi:hypothetical protein
VTCSVVVRITKPVEVSTMVSVVGIFAELWNDRPVLVMIVTMTTATKIMIVMILFRVV